MSTWSNYNTIQRIETGGPPKRHLPFGIPSWTVMRLDRYSLRQMIQGCAMTESTCAKCGKFQRSQPEERHSAAGPIERTPVSVAGSSGACTLGVHVSKRDRLHCLQSIKFDAWSNHWGAVPIDNRKAAQPIFDDGDNVKGNSKNLFAVMETLAHPEKASASIDHWAGYAASCCLVDGYHTRFKEPRLFQRRYDLQAVSSWHESVDHSAAEYGTKMVRLARLVRRLGPQ